MMSSMPTQESGDAFIADLRARRKPRLFVISGPSGVGKDRFFKPTPDGRYPAPVL